MRKKSVYKNKMNNCDPFHSVFSLALALPFLRHGLSCCYIICFICKIGVKVATNLP